MVISTRNVFMLHSFHVYDRMMHEVNETKKGFHVVSVFRGRLALKCWRIFFIWKYFEIVKNHEEFFCSFWRASSVYQEDSMCLDDNIGVMCG